MPPLLTLARRDNRRPREALRIRIRTPLVAVPFGRIAATSIPIGDLLKEKWGIWPVAQPWKRRQNVVAMGDFLNWTSPVGLASGDAVIGKPGSVNHPVAQGICSCLEGVVVPKNQPDSRSNWIDPAAERWMLVPN